MKLILTHSMCAAFIALSTSVMRADDLPAIVKLTTTPERLTLSDLRDGRGFLVNGVDAAGKVVGVGDIRAQTRQYRCILGAEPRTGKIDDFQIASKREQAVKRAAPQQIVLQVELTATRTGENLATSIRRKSHLAQSQSIYW